MTAGHRIDIDHRTEKAFVNHPQRHRARCSCGWLCPEWRRSEDEAQSDGFQHQAMIEAEPEWDEAA